jgi:hypothetical protein
MCTSCNLKTFKVQCNLEADQLFRGPLNFADLRLFFFQALSPSQSFYVTTLIYLKSDLSKTYEAHVDVSRSHLQNEHCYGSESYWRRWANLLLLLFMQKAAKALLLIYYPKISHWQFQPTMKAILQ